MIPDLADHQEDIEICSQSANIPVFGFVFSKQPSRDWRHLTNLKQQNVLLVDFSRDNVLLMLRQQIHAMDLTLSKTVSCSFQFFGELLILFQRMNIGGFEL
jgi:hypothetical protein